MKIVINRKFGGFGLSHAAYEKLIEYGIPTRPYKQQKRGDDGLYLPEPANDGEVIFDSRVDEGDGLPALHSLRGTPYWDSWIRRDEGRAHPLVVRVVEELGEAASGRFADLAVVEIPDGVDWEIDEYDGMETIHEKHRSWG